MTRDELEAAVEPGTILLDPAEVFDPGVVGFTPDRKHVIYDAEEIAAAMIEEYSCTEDEAMDDISYNTVGSLGSFPEEYRPIIMQKIY